ncbi:helix-turn-helix domain-containing protein [Paenibacillus sp. DS2015]|uniref:helix-turn-helix domain-containing protein n=1 Tax=Paenibacillus sp. DS2015 TaxID=3373917 RepID=UPI003D1A0EC6
MIVMTDVHQDNGVDWYEEWSPHKETWHLILLTYGKYVYWVNENKIIMEKGDILLIPSHTPYYGKSIPTVFHTKYVINFDISCRDAKLPILRSHGPLKRKLGCYGLIYERFKTILNQWEERPSYYVMMAEALLIEALIYINQEWDRGEIPPETHRQVDNMKDYIQKHYREKVTKHELGEAIRKTPNYAATLFRSVTNQTISEYVHKQRIKKAMYVLTESQLTIEEISKFVGYNDVSYFYRIFKRITGSSPSDFLHERSTIL